MLRESQKKALREYLEWLKKEREKKNEKQN